MLYIDLNNQLYIVPFPLKHKSSLPSTPFYVTKISQNSAIRSTQNTVHPESVAISICKPIKVYGARTEEITIEGTERMGVAPLHANTITGHQNVPEALLSYNTVLYKPVFWGSAWHRVIAVPQATICSRRSARNCYKSFDVLANIDPIRGLARRLGHAHALTRWDLSAVLRC